MSEQRGSQSVHKKVRSVIRSYRSSVSVEWGLEEEHARRWHVKNQILEEAEQQR